MKKLLLTTAICGLMFLGNSQTHTRIALDDVIESNSIVSKTMVTKTRLYYDENLQQIVCVFSDKNMKMVMQSDSTAIYLNDSLVRKNASNYQFERATPRLFLQQNLGYDLHNKKLKTQETNDGKIVKIYTDGTRATFDGELLMEIVYYEKKRKISSKINFDDYREFDGLQIPQTMRITTFPISQDKPLIQTHHFINIVIDEQGNDAMYNGIGK